MGGSQSKQKITPNNTTSKNVHYSDKDIENNIKKLFVDRKEYVIETSDESLGYNNVTGGFMNDLDDQSYLNTDTTSNSSLNYESAYTSGRARYEKYDVTQNILPQIQDGGNLSDILADLNSETNYTNSGTSSEFQKIKQYMLDNLGNQEGGNDSSSSSSSDLSSSSSSQSTPEYDFSVVGGNSTSIQINKSSNSSELGIRPFTSSDTSELSFRHPYNKSRF